MWAAMIATTSSLLLERRRHRSHSPQAGDQDVRGGSSALSLTTLHAHCVCTHDTLTKAQRFTRKGDDEREDAAALVSRNAQRDRGIAFSPFISLTPR